MKDNTKAQADLMKSVAGILEQYRDKLSNAEIIGVLQILQHASITAAIMDGTK